MGNKVQKVPVKRVIDVDFGPFEKGKHAQGNKEGTSKKWACGCW
jgi:hypothetical protein